MQSDDSPAAGSVQKSATGIHGLDFILGGGFPQGGMTLLEGGPGTGKTLLALQSLMHGARHCGEPGILVAFEESSGRVIANAASFGWNLPALLGKKLFLLDAQPRHDVVQSGDFDLEGLLAALDAQIAQMGARRLVFDAIDVVLSMLENRTLERRELYRIRDWIGARDLSTVVTCKAGPNGPSRRLRGVMQFMADCVVSLDHSLVNGVSQRSLRVLKYRGSGFHENGAPYIIGPQGLLVAGPGADPDLSVPITHERVSTGVKQLDAMLGGGFFRAASILTTGAPGTAKTTLAGAFAEAACVRGEPTLFVTFDSDPAEVARNLASVGIRLGRHIGTGRKPGLLRMSYGRALQGSAETHLLRIQEMADQHKARCVVVDPLSALAKAGNDPTAQSVAKRLMDGAKTRGITIYCTSLLETGGQDIESSQIQVSTMADTWMHLSYLVRGGERNRCISVIKSRGTAHSNQVRELVLAADGVSLAEPYTAGGEVLLGTLRWEREQAEQGARRESERMERQMRTRLENEEAELSAQLERLGAQLRDKRLELETATLEAVTRRDVTAVGESELRSRRGATPATQNRSKRVSRR